MSDVFVSYKTEDRRRVKPLVAALEADGYSVWWDTHIGGAAAWRETIEHELNAARCVVVVWSHGSVGLGGSFVRDEASRAWEQGTYLPVKIDDCRPPLGFGETQVLSLVGWKGKPADPRYQAVVTTARAMIDGALRPPITSDTASRGISRRTIIGSGVVVAAGAAGLGAWGLFRAQPEDRGESIAVLPFANLSGDPKQAYFSDGVAEEIRSALTRIAGLTVIGRTSSEAVRYADAPTAARRLHVRNILTGTVRETVSTIRISTELIDGKTGADRWSRNYDRAPGDAIKIQTDIAEKVARAVSTTFRAASRAALSAGGTQNAAAQRLLLQSLAAARAGTKGGCLRGLRLLEAAIAADGRYGEAYARRAYLLEFYAEHYANTLAEVNAYRSPALQSANTALRLAPDLSLAHWALAQYLAGILDLAGADSAYRRAVQLGPGDAGPLSDYSLLVLRVGDPGRALALSNRALMLDPLDPDAYRRRFLVLYYRRDFGKALAFTKEVQANSPELFIWPADLALALISVNKLEEAQRYLERAPSDYYQRIVGECVILIRKKQQEEAKTKLAAFERAAGDTDNYQYAQIYAQLGDKDRAFAALNRAWALRDTGLSWLRVDPLLDPIRGDQRFASLVRRLTSS